MDNKVEFNYEEYRNKMEDKVRYLEEQLAKKQNEIEKLKEPVSNVDLDYKVEYYKLRKIEAENQELKDTIINMSKSMFNLFNGLNDVIKDIDRELKVLARRR